MELKKYESISQKGLFYWAETSLDKTYHAVVSQAQGFPATQAHDDWFRKFEDADRMAMELAYEIDPDQRRNYFELLFGRVDWPMLAQQKLVLVKESMKFESDPLTDDAINGIINLLDHIQDYAVDVIGLDKKLVFPHLKPDESGDLIQDIINRKKNGIDCTEEESAQIKEFLRERVLAINSWEIPMVEDIQELFPREYGEYLDEEE